MRGTPSCQSIGRWTAYAAVVSLASASLIGFAGAWGWFPDLFAHFRLHYAIGGTLVGVVLLLLKHRWWAAAASGVVLLNATLIAPLYFGSHDQDVPDGPTLKLMSYNVYYANETFGETVASIRASDADIVLVLEATPKWMEAAEHTEPYKMACAWTHPSSISIALLSKIPLKDVRTYAPQNCGMQVIEATIQLGKGNIAFLGVHPWPPLNPQKHGYRARQLEIITQWVRAQTLPVVIAGDFNATPWSSPYRDFVEDTHLVNALEGYGYHATWPSSLGPLGIPIDHCFHSAGLTVTDFRIGDPCGSDHAPIHVTLARAR